MDVLARAGAADTVNTASASRPVPDAGSARRFELHPQSRYPDGRMDPKGSGSWLSRTLFSKNETLIAHDNPIMVASTLRAPLLRFVYQRLRFMADRLCDSSFERTKFGLEMLQNQVTLRCQQSTVLDRSIKAATAHVGGAGVTATVQKVPCRHISMKPSNDPTE